MADIRPSDQRDRVQQGVGAFNAEIPLPQDEGILDDKRTAYEQAEMEQNRKQRVRPLEDFAPSEEDEPEGAVAEPPGSNPERFPFRDYSGDRDDRSSVAAYRDINRQLGSFYEQPQADGEKEEPEKAGGGTDRQAGRKGAAGGRNRRSGGADGEELRTCRQVYGTERAGRRSRAGARHRAGRKRFGTAYRGGTGGTGADGIGVATDHK